MNYLSKIDFVDLKAACKFGGKIQCSLKPFFGDKVSPICYQLLESLPKAVIVNCSIRKMIKHRLNVLPRGIGFINFLENMKVKQLIPFIFTCQKSRTIPKFPSQYDQIRGHSKRNPGVRSFSLSCIKPRQPHHSDNSASPGTRERSPGSTNFFFEKFKADYNPGNESKKKYGEICDYLWGRVHARNSAGIRPPDQSLPLFLAAVS